MAQGCYSNRLAAFQGDGVYGACAHAYSAANAGIFSTEYAGSSRAKPLGAHDGGYEGWSAAFVEVTPVLRLHALDAFSGTLFTLLTEKAFEDVAASELCRRSGYPRATFYNYFDDNAKGHGSPVK